MKTINQLIEVIDQLILSIQNRADYSKITFQCEESGLLSAQEVVESFNDFKETSITLLETKESLPKELIFSIQKIAAGLIYSNSRITKMNQLSTALTISKRYAEEQNQILQQLNAILERYNIEKSAN